MFITLIVIFLSLSFLMVLDYSLMTVSLLMNMLVIVLILFFEFNFHWVSLLYGITIISGLMVIFTYISSVSPKNPSLVVDKSKLLFFFFFMSMLFSLLDLSIYMEKKDFFLSNFFYNDINFLNEGLFLFFLLFLLIIFFLRFTYGKGGGFRKKY